MNRIFANLQILFPRPTKPSTFYNDQIIPNAESRIGYDDQE
jgi:hypothetical protein